MAHLESIEDDWDADCEYCPEGYPVATECPNPRCDGEGYVHIDQVPTGMAWYCGACCSDGVLEKSDEIRAFSARSEEEEDGARSCVRQL